jgi:capsular polysaccharide biosynthesis protein
LELRQYVAVIRRRWPLVAAIVVLTALFSLGLLLTQRPTHSAFIRLAVRQNSLPSQPPTATQPGFFTYDRYYNFYSSEFLADDYTIIVTSRAFADATLARLKDARPDLARGGLPGFLTTDRKQRELTIIATAANDDTALALARAAGDVLTGLSAPASVTPNANGIGIHDDAQFALIDPAAPAGTNSSRQLANAAISMVVGLALAFALAFLFEYLDNSLRDLADAEQVIGLPVVGAIPGGR